MVSTPRAAERAMLVASRVGFTNVGSGPSPTFLFHLPPFSNAQLWLGRLAKYRENAVGPLNV